MSDLTNWCYENPKQAAMKIEGLQSKLLELEIVRRMVLKILPTTDMDVFDEQEYQYAKEVLNG